MTFTVLLLLTRQAGMSISETTSLLELQVESYVQPSVGFTENGLKKIKWHWVPLLSTKKNIYTRSTDNRRLEKHCQV